jgi:ABC-type sugar transport system substrate-binding protein
MNAWTFRRSTTMAFLFVAVSLAGHLFAADKELKAVGLTVGDLGNPFFV